MLTLADAAKHAGTSKSSLFRWIKSGRISATKADDGTYRIDPAELQRYLDSVSAEAHRERGVEQSEPASGVSADAATLRERNAALEAEIAGLKALLEAERRRADELKENGEHWREQAQRLALAPPQPASVPAAPRGFWKKLFG
jgi:excisionase family DNA binding protein